MKSHTLFDLASIQHRCSDQVSPAEFYQLLNRQGLQLGDLFRGLQKLWRGNDEALGYVQLPAQLSQDSDRDNYHYPPGLFDICCQLVQAALPLALLSDESIFYIPIGLQHFTVYRNLGTNVWVYAQLDRSNAADNRVEGNVHVLADDGTEIAVIQGLRLKQGIQKKTVIDEENNQAFREHLYKVQWTTTQLSALLEQPREVSARTWLLLIDHQGIGEDLQNMLTQRGQRCVCVMPGAQFCQLAEASYQVDITDPQWATSLLRIEQGQGAHTFTDILHLWSLDTTPTQEMDEQTLLRDQALSAGSALTLMQALIASAHEPFPRCWLVTRGAQSVGEDQTQLAMVQALLWGLGKILAMEHPELWGGLLDLDAHETSAASAAHLLQWTQLECKEDRVAFRHGSAYAARLVHASMSLLDTEPLVVHPDASYLITGGLQGVGLLMARWFVEHGVRYLVLTDRTQLPPRPQWHHLKSGDPFLEKVAGIRELEALGAQVQYAAVDVSNRVQLTALLTTLPVLGYPALRGVVHASSIWQDHEGRPFVRPLSNLTAAAMFEVFRPNVFGSWLLSTLLHEIPLDFFISFSEMNLSDQTAAHHIKNMVYSYHRMPKEKIAEQKSL